MRVGQRREPYGADYTNLTSLRLAASPHLSSLRQTCVPLLERWPEHRATTPSASRASVEGLEGLASCPASTVF